MKLNSLISLLFYAKLFIFLRMLLLFISKCQKLWNYRQLHLSVSSGKAGRECANMCCDNPSAHSGGCSQHGSINFLTCLVMFNNMYVYILLHCIVVTQLLDTDICTVINVFFYFHKEIGDSQLSYCNTFLQFCFYTLWICYN